MLSKNNRKNIFTATLLAVGLQIGGCKILAQNEVSVSTSERETAIQYTKRMVVDVVNKLDKLVTPLSAKEEITEAYHLYKNTLFPIKAGQDGVMRNLASYCGRSNGAFAQGACVSLNDEVLFYAKIKATGYVTPYPGFHKEYELTVVESTPPGNQQFMSKIYELGYRP